MIKTSNKNVICIIYDLGGTDAGRGTAHGKQIRNHHRFYQNFEYGYQIIMHAGGQVIASFFTRLSTIYMCQNLKPIRKWSNSSRSLKKEVNYPNGHLDPQFSIVVISASFSKCQNFDSIETLKIKMWSNKIRSTAQ